MKVRLAWSFVTTKRKKSHCSIAQSTIFLRISTGMAGDDVLYSRLCAMEQEFLSALDGDERTLELFSIAWASLQRDIESAQNVGALSQETAELAYIVSTRITVVAEAFQELDETAEKLTNQLKEELEQIVGDVSHGQNKQGDYFSSKH